MASFTNRLCFLFLLTILMSSLQIHARESHFFSKVSRNREDENELLKKNEIEAKLFEKQLDLQEEQPSFIPQTSDNNGYGLYGHETGLDSPSTTTTATTPVSLVNKNVNAFEGKNNKNDVKFGDNQGEQNYVPKLTGLSETSYTNDVGPKTKYVAKNNYNNNNNNNNNNNRENIGISQREKNYVPELTGLNEFSYSNNVAPQKDVDNNNNNNNNEDIQKNQRDEYYVPSETSFSNNVVGPTKYVAENNYNNKNNDEIYGDRLSDTSYTNKVVPSNYVAENNYNNFDNQNNNNHNNNHNQIFRNNPEFTKLSDTSYTNKVVPSNYVSENNYNNNNNREGMYNTNAEYNGGVEKQGMSDTRYLENGKYYYDINDEKKFYPSNNHMSYSNNYGNHHNYVDNDKDFNNKNNGQLYGYKEDSYQKHNNNYYGNDMKQEFEDQP